MHYKQYTYSDADMRQYAALWAEGNTGIQIATAMKKTAKESDAIYQACKKRGMIKARKAGNKRRIVNISEQDTIKQKLVAAIDADAHKMGQMAKFAWEMLRTSL